MPRLPLLLLGLPFLASPSPVAQQTVYVTLVRTEGFLVRATSAAKATEAAQARLLNEDDIEDKGYRANADRVPLHQFFLVSATPPKEQGPKFAFPTADIQPEHCPVPAFNGAQTMRLVGEDSGSWSVNPRFIVSLEPHALKVEAASASAAVSAVKKLVALPLDDPKHPANSDEWNRSYCYPSAPFYAPLRHGWEYVSTAIRRS